MDMEIVRLRADFEEKLVTARETTLKYWRKQHDV